MNISVIAPVLTPDLSRLSERTRGGIDFVAYIDGLKSDNLCGRNVHVPHGALLAVSGWAADPRSANPFDEVVLVIDDRFAFATEAGLDRTDVQALLGRHISAYSGFRGVVTTHTLGRGRHRLAAYARTKGTGYREAASVTFATVPPVLDISSPQVRPSHITIDSIGAAHPVGVHGTGAPVIPAGQDAFVSGWAVDPSTGRAPAGICAVTEDGSLWTTVCDRKRPDARVAFGAADDMIGFELLVPTGNLARRLQDLTLWTYDDVGRPFGLPERKAIDIAAEMRGFPGFAREVEGDVTVHFSRRSKAPERPGGILSCVRGDVIALEGWVACDTIADPSQMFIELQPAALPSRMRYQPLAGFRRKESVHRLDRDDDGTEESIHFAYPLDTSNLAPLDYAIFVAVIAADRCSYARGKVGTLRVGAPDDGSATSARRR